MDKKLNETVKKIVNKNYPCSECEERDYCKFWKGSNTAFDCCECTADEFADGVYATINHLASIPWNEAMRIIVDSVKEDLL